MFKIIFQILILIYIIFVIYNIINIQKYNVNGFIIHTDQYETLNENIHKLNPVLFHSNKESNIIDTLIESHPQLSLEQGKQIKDYHLIDNIYMYKDNEKYDSLDIKRHLTFDVNKLRNTEINLIDYYSLSILKGKQSVPLTLASHNYNIIGVLEGEATIYLFNPKHKDDIMDKENKKIKKWGHKKKKQKNDIILIPPFWNYIEECENQIIQYHIDIDNIFTFIPNYIRNM